MPLPASQLNNNKFKTRLRVLFQIIKVISDQNYLVEDLSTTKKKVVHHGLLRYIQPALVEKMVNKYNYKLSVDVPDALTITHSDPAQLDNKKDTLE